MPVIPLPSFWQTGKEFQEIRGRHFPPTSAISNLAPMRLSKNLRARSLDFMYKNNCIRTQKKQKVFYWYSVPHDRLFLDALERDLKREKMGQEATTMAVNEPALSFEFDSSQSLFEQLTKSQQANTSSFSANASSRLLAVHFSSPSRTRLHATSIISPSGGHAYCLGGDSDANGRVLGSLNASHCGY